MKKKLQCICLLLYACTGAFASSKMGHTINSEYYFSNAKTSLLTKHLTQDVITGTVRDSTGSALVGITVLIKGTTKGTQTNAQGTFSLSVQPGDVLVISSIGYTTKEVTVGDEKNINIILHENARQLSDIIVTALGVRSSQKSLSYAAQKINGSELNNVKTDNMMNALNGKVAGLDIQPSASGVGGSVKVLLRGARSFAGNNQPLYVIDGVPLGNPVNVNSQGANATSKTTGNTSGQPNSNFGGSDGGDGISNLNPDDVESITVLEGASAAALYGSQAANGVILITTKKGKNGNPEINFASSFMASNAVAEPKFQNQYGRTSSDTQTSWGNPISGSTNNLKDYFQTGVNWTNSLNLSMGNESAQTYFSYANTMANGIEPENKLRRNNFNIRESAKFLNSKLIVDGSVNYIDQKVQNSPALGLYLNPLVGLYLFPRGLDITPYKNQYALPSPLGAGVDLQNWISNNDDSQQQNPWWTTYKDPNVLQRNRIIINGSVKYEFTDWMNVQVRGSLDRTADNSNTTEYAGTISTYNSNGLGHLTYNNQTTEQKYGDAIINFNAPKWGVFKLDGLVGVSITDVLLDGTGANGDLASTPNFFSTSNIIPGKAVPTPYFQHTQLQSVFESANLSYKNWVYLALTNRTDWNSTLAYTSTVHYDYPSAGLSFMLSQMFQMPHAISYAKLRGSYANVGNGVPPYLTHIQNTQNISTGALTFNNSQALATLKPENTHSYEIGTDWRFINDRINLSFTYYNTHTYNQYFTLSPPAPTLITQGFVNAGNIENSGIEFTLGGDIIKHKHLPGIPL
jgi:TonB-linked SusC/RagA family outer membrane protein